MKKVVLVLLGCICLLSSCNEYTSVLKTTDYEYKYEFAKACFVKGQYSRASTLLGDLLSIMKGTARGEESLYLLAMSEYRAGNYDTASSYFKKYYQSYPKGIYAEYARFYCGRSLYEGVPDPRLDQSGTLTAIEEFQIFLDYYPYTPLKDRTQEMIFSLQDILVIKEYNAAKLYYDLGSYMGNCTSGGSNYEACIVTAENALRDYPYASAERREEFAILVLRAKYQLAAQSVEDKRLDRYRNTIDEYYGFVNEYPESKYMKEAARILASSQKIVENSK
ncbi:MAG: outer membrane protein assembly factor BamD [Clostridium sp.]|nr:outer membrane protein assembly factor BamD [Clostridium sp.]